MAASRRASLTQKHLSSTRGQEIKSHFSMEDSVSIQPNHSAKKPSSKKLNRQISLYALAASAAGVSVLALAQPAQSEVVITKKTVPIAPSTFVGISFANNGINDFSFFLSAAFSSFSTLLDGYNLSMRSLKNGKGIVGTRPTGAIRPDVSALVRGAKIGPSADFVSSVVGDFGVTVERSFIPYGGGPKQFVGKWGGNPKNRYVGVRFLINGETHYGWVRLTVTTPPDKFISAKITAYAYETVANKPIQAGIVEAPIAEIQALGDIQNQSGPSLGMLALGADGLSRWRREDTLTSR
jgi:hypothetical protein